MYICIVVGSPGESSQGGANQLRSPATTPSYLLEGPDPRRPPMPDPVGLAVPSKVTAPHRTLPYWNSALLGDGSRASGPHKNPLSKAEVLRQAVDP